jgi:anti-sigma regulatory factor (Ser/Thr protein kinase)
MNLRTLRALLNNLIELSFDQEELMDRVKKADTEDPAYTDLGREQKRIKEDFGKIRDSLHELSKQVFQLKATIDQEVEKADRNMRKSIDLLGERNPGKAASRQQYSMTALNELALLLDESLQQIQKKLAMKMPGKGNCQKPGGKGMGSPSLSKLRQMQERLNKKMKQMQQGNKGNKKGGQKGQKGQKGKGGKGQQSGMSKELAKLAREQAAIRRKLKELSQQLDPSGKGIGNQLQRIADQMEQTEEDIVNKKIDQRTLKRQAEIESRLLESEKAERKRGFKKERKGSRTPQDGTTHLGPLLQKESGPLLRALSRTRPMSSMDQAVYATRNELDLPSSLDNLPRVEKFIDEACESFHIDEDFYGNILIAVTEAVNNAIQHGNQEDPDRTFTVSFEADEELQKLTFRVEDSGEGFDYENVPDPTAPENLEKPYGRGIFLMRNLSDEVEFYDEGRVVELTFRLQKD